LELIKQDCVAIQISPLVYQITTSNLCNQACVSCNSGASTKWAEIEKRMGVVPTRLTELDFKNIDIDYSTARRISLLGGEPFFDPATFTILENLVKQKNTDCFISIVTNGSIELSQSKLDLLSKFTDLNVCISIDGVGPVFEYVRWPAKWNVVCDNIKKFQQITNNISISYTISSLNILYYQETIEWFKSQKLRYNHNIVTDPTWLSLDTMPVEIKQLVAEDKFAKPWAKITGREISLKDYYDRLHAQDQAKKINVQNYLPKFATIFDNLV
jgi:MoaA/NifB/PqqE/SkfB family radical SAM enzyme